MNDMSRPVKPDATLPSHDICAEDAPVKNNKALGKLPYLGVTGAITPILSSCRDTAPVPVRTSTPDTAKRPDTVQEDSSPINSQHSTDSVSPETASRFLQMAAFAASDADIHDIVSNGTDVWLDTQLNMQPVGSRYEWLIENGFKDRSHRFNLSGFNSCVWQRIFKAENKVAQRWAVALAEIFVINAAQTRGSGWWKAHAGAAYLDLLERHAFGHYRALIEDITLHHGMGAYLSLSGSRSADESGRAPDENYAREILQLFSIGLYELNIDGSVKLDFDGNPIETYTNNDIVGLASALTGWGNNFTKEEMRLSPKHHLRPMVMTETDHDSRELHFLGATVPAGTSGEQALKIALDTIANHPNVGPFLSEQFIKRLVTSNPTRAYVARVSSVFNRDNNGARGNLGAVLRAILLDPEASGDSPVAENRRGKLREPMLRFMQWGKTFSLDDPAGDWKIPDLSDPDDALGQSPLFSPSVFNYFRPGFVPSNTDAGDMGLTVPELQITNETSVIGYANFMYIKISNGINSIQPDYSAEVALAENSALLVDRLNLLLAANQLSQETYDLIVQTVESMPGGDDDALRKRVQAAILMVMVSPDYLVIS